jgi:ferredoxin
MRVVVDLDVCEGNAVCVERWPHLFTLHDDKAIAPSGDVSEWRSQVGEAVLACPVQAISIVDDEPANPASERWVLDA